MNDEKQNKKASSEVSSDLQLCYFEISRINRFNESNDMFILLRKVSRDTGVHIHSTAEPDVIRVTAKKEFLDAVHEEISKCKAPTAAHHALKTLITDIFKFLKSTKRYAGN